MGVKKSTVVISDLLSSNLYIAASSLKSNPARRSSSVNSGRLSNISDKLPGASLAAQPAALAYWVSFISISTSLSEVFYHKITYCPSAAL